MHAMSTLLLITLQYNVFYKQIKDDMVGTMMAVFERFCYQWITIISPLEIIKYENLTIFKFNNQEWRNIVIYWQQKETLFLVWPKCQKYFQIVNFCWVFLLKGNWQELLLSCRNLTIVVIKDITKFLATG